MPAIVFAVLLSAGLAAAKPAAAGTIETMMLSARQGGDKTLFAIPTSANVDKFSTLVNNWAAAGTVPSATDLSLLGFESLVVQGVGGSVLCIRERTGVRGGGGVYFFPSPATSGSKMVITCPHSFYDLRTGLIGARVYELSRLGGLMVNTVHRYNAATTGSTVGNPADVAHNQLNYFYGGIVGLARGRPSAIFVQLHGMDGSSTGFDFVLSDGTKAPPANGVLAKAAASFRAQFGTAVVGVYGQNVSTLGGTTNTGGVFLNGLAPGLRFLHVEMSPTRRSLLESSATERSKLFQALSAATQ